MSKLSDFVGGGSVPIIPPFPLPASPANYPTLVHVADGQLNWQILPGDVGGGDYFFLDKAGSSIQYYNAAATLVWAADFTSIIADIGGTWDGWAGIGYDTDTTGPSLQADLYCVVHASTGSTWAVVQIDPVDGMAQQLGTDIALGTDFATLPNFYSTLATTNGSSTVEKILGVDEIAVRVRTANGLEESIIVVGNSTMPNPVVIALEAYPGILDSDGVNISQFVTTQASNKVDIRIATAGVSLRLVLPIGFLGYPDMAFTSTEGAKPF